MKNRPCKHGLFAALLALAVLAACGAPEQGAQVIPETAETAPAEAAQAGDDAAAAEYHLLCESLAYCAGGASDAGFYRMRLNGDGTGNLLYYDHSTRKLLYLSSQVNATHQSEDDTSYFASVVGGAQSLCDGDYVYVAKQTNNVLLKQNDARGLGYCCRLDLDGQNRKTVTLAADEFLDPMAGLASSNGNLFFVMTKTRADTTQETCLMAADFARNKLDSVFVFDDTVRPFLVGSIEKGLVFALNDDEQETQTLAYWNEAQGEMVPIPIDVSEIEYIIDNETGVLYGASRSGSGGILQINAETGETKEIAAFPDGVPRENITFGRSIVDSHLFISVDSGDEPLRCALDLRDGTWHWQTLKAGEYEVPIYAVFADDYLVRLEDFEEEIDDSLPDGTPIKTTTTSPHYALIAKEDYWQNIPRYMEFENTL